jgi:hypothetical protein
MKNRIERSIPQSIHRRNFSRACTCMALAKLRNRYPEEVLKQHFCGDDSVERILRAVSKPQDSTTFWAAQSGTYLPALAPASAHAQLMSRGHTVSLTGVHTYKIPFIPQSGRPTQVPWVGEGQPGPVFMMTDQAPVLGPVNKLMCFVGFTRELEEYAVEAASEILGDALRIVTTQSLDLALFSATAAGANNPAGILNGLTAIPSVGGTGLTGMADDIGKIASAMNAAGINPDDMVLFTSAENVAKIKTMAGPKFDYEVFSAAHIPDTTLIGVQPDGFWTAYGDSAMSVETSIETTLHFEDTTPLAIVNGGGMATPTRNLFQQEMLALRVRAWATWAVYPGAVQYVTAASW